MFYPGTKVKVLAHMKEGPVKKTTPKAGSIGYYSRNQSRTIFDINAIIPSMGDEFGHIGLTIRLMTVIFSRFGNEEKPRCERKDVWVINIIPDSIGDNKLREKVGEFVTKAHNKFFDGFGDPKGKQVVKSVNLERALANGRVDDVVVLGDASMSAQDCVSDHTVFMPWFKSVYESDHFRRHIHSVLTNNKSFVLKNPEYNRICRVIHQICFDEGDWREKLDRISADPQERKKFTHMVSILSAAEGVSRYKSDKKAIQSFERDRGMDPKIDAESFYTQVVDRRLNDVFLKEMAEAFMALGRSYSAEGILKILAAKNYYQFLSSSL